jgi:hypothetical protein
MHRLWPENRLDAFEHGSDAAHFEEKNISILTAMWNEFVAVAGGGLMEESV